MRALVAINRHAFHDPQYFDRCCESTQIAVETATQRKNDEIDILVFTNTMNDEESHQSWGQNTVALREVSLDPGPNGYALNQQLEYAIDHGYEIFFRVDSDDAVDPQRFQRQLDLFRRRPDCDLCGGGLKFENLDNGVYHAAIPPVKPGSLDYLINRYCFHPTFALKLKSFTKVPRYWCERVEDKKFLLDSKRLGLQVINDQAIYGTYYHTTNTRSTWAIHRKCFKLDVAWALQFNKLFVVLAVIIFVARLALPTDILRSIRKDFFSRTQIRNQTGEP